MRTSVDCLRRNNRRILLALLVVVLSTVMVGCAQPTVVTPPPGIPETGPGTEKDFPLQIIDQEGKGVSGVTVILLYQGKNKSDVTDQYGYVSFPLLIELDGVRAELLIQKGDETIRVKTTIDFDSQTLTIIIYITREKSTFYGTRKSQ